MQNKILFFSLRILRYKLVFEKLFKTTQIKINMQNCHKHHANLKCNLFFEISINFTLGSYYIGFL